MKIVKRPLRAAWAQACLSAAAVINASLAAWALTDPAEPISPLSLGVILAVSAALLTVGSLLARRRS